MLTRIRNFFLWLSIPVQKFLQRSGDDEPHMTIAQARECINVLQPGHIVLTFENGRPTSYLIPGAWDHAAICSSKITIIEAVGDLIKDGKNLGGVREVDALEFFLKKDNVCIIEVVYLNADLDYIPKNAGADSLSFIGRAYDYFFKFLNENIYCSELVYTCYRISDTDFLKHIPENRQILPNDFYVMAKTGKAYGLCQFRILKEIKNV